MIIIMKIILHNNVSRTSEAILFSAPELREHTYNQGGDLHGNDRHSPP